MNGALLSVPLTFGASNTEDDTPSCNLHMHVERVEGESSFLFTAVSIGGSYHGKIPSQELIIQISLPYWSEYIPYLCGENDLHRPEWVLSAKLSEAVNTASSSQSRLSKIKGMHLTLVVSIKTLGDLPITMGSVELEAVDSTGVTGPLLARDINLFNWLDALQLRNDSLVARVSEAVRSRDVLKQQLEETAAAYEGAVLEHKLIVGNLDRAYYTLLNAKKDKIWELLKGIVPQDRLDNLRSVPFGEGRQIKQESLIKVEPEQGMTCNVNSELCESVYESYDAELVRTNINCEESSSHTQKVCLRLESPPKRAKSIPSCLSDKQRRKRTSSELTSDESSGDSCVEEDKHGPERENSARETANHPLRRIAEVVEDRIVKRETGGKGHSHAWLDTTDSISESRQERCERITAGSKMPMADVSAQDDPNLPMLVRENSISGVQTPEAKEQASRPPSRAQTKLVSDVATDYESSDSDD